MLAEGNSDVVHVFTPHSFNYVRIGTTLPHVPNAIAEKTAKMGEKHCQRIVAQDEEQGAVWREEM